jgi:citrate lyase subunit beta/citryl-CoA lyase
MNRLIRRSNLLMPFDDDARVAEAWRADADAITLDRGTHTVSIARLRESVAQCRRGGAEVFVTVAADDAAVPPPVHGLAGYVLRGVRSGDQLRQFLERLEGDAEIVPVVGSAQAVWDIRAIVTASPRIRQVILDEAALAADLGIRVDQTLDPFVYARGRVVTETIAAGVSPVGMSFPLSVLGDERAAEEIHQAAMKAKNTGLKGVLCPYASWVGPVNRAFTPTPELVEWNRRVREAFAAGVAQGTAAVPLDGKMIDVPVDEWAIVVLAMAEACAARDAEKRAARALHP